MNSTGKEECLSTDSADTEQKHDLSGFLVTNPPNYVSHADEETVFRAAHSTRIPLILKGPTGCGKTRFVEYMAHKIGVPLMTVSCHEDLTASDLLGRYLLKNEETVWQDGPLTLAARHGGICYLDEIVEARKDTTVIIHSLTDDRRTLFLDKTGEVIHADPKFMLVLSYNPGYQSIVKELKESTKQRFAALTFDHPDIETETSIISSESGLDPDRSARLAEMGARIRELRGYGLNEGVSSRLLVYVARLIVGGLMPMQACRAAIVHSLTEESEVSAAVEDIVKLFFGDILEPSHVPDN